MNWGKGIIIAMSLFIVFIVTMVVQMMRQDVTMITDEYYQKELHYNEQYAALNNYNEASAPIQIQQIGDSMFVLLPSDLMESELALEFKRLDDASKDLSFTLPASEKIYLPKKMFAHGHYDAIIKGQRQGKAFECNQKVDIR